VFFRDSDGSTAGDDRCVVDAVDRDGQLRRVAQAKRVMHSIGEDLGRSLAGAESEHGSGTGSDGVGEGAVGRHSERAEGARDRSNRPEGTACGLGAKANAIDGFGVADGRIRIGVIGENIARRIARAGVVDGGGRGADDGSHSTSPASERVQFDLSRHVGVIAAGGLIDHRDRAGAGILTNYVLKPSASELGDVARAGTADEGVVATASREPVVFGATIERVRAVAARERIAKAHAENLHAVSRVSTPKVATDDRVAEDGALDRVDVECRLAVAGRELPATQPTSSIGGMLVENVREWERPRRREVGGVVGVAAQDEVVAELRRTEDVANAAAAIVDREIDLARRHHGRTRGQDEGPCLAGLEDIAARAVDDDLGAQCQHVADGDVVIDGAGADIEQDAPGRELAVVFDN
jgi:hypothetical protein